MMNATQLLSVHSIRNFFLALVAGLTLAQPAALAQNDALTPSERAAIERAEGVSEAFSSVARRARPSVGRIVGYGPRGTRITGSGFVIDHQGHMLTNNHVVESAVSLVVEFSDGSATPARLVGTDPLTDLAVIRIDRDDVAPLPFSDSSDLEVGQWVVAVGFPLGLDQTVTVGIVSATNRRLNIVGASVNRRGYEDFIQTDAAINRGNSGGPLLNLDSQVVGVNAVIVTETGGSDGLGFAIPTSLAQYVTDQLIRHGQVTRAWLGVALQDLTEPLARSYGLPREQSGVLLTAVSPDEPAGRAGLAVEDIILAINGQPVRDVEDLRDQVARMRPGTDAAVDVFRNGRNRSFNVILAQMSETQTAAMNRAHRPVSAEGRIGVRIEDVLRRQASAIGEQTAVSVANVFPGSTAQRAGLAEGDLIVAIDGEPLKSVILPGERISYAKWVIDMIDSAPSGTVMRFTVRSRVVNSAGRIAGIDPNRSFVAIEMP